MRWRRFLIRAVVLFPWTPCLTMAVRSLDATGAGYDPETLAQRERGVADDGATFRPDAGSPELHALPGWSRAARRTAPRAS